MRLGAGRGGQCGCSLLPRQRLSIGRDFAPGENNLFRFRITEQRRDAIVEPQLGGVPERGGELAVEVFVVLDDEQAHGELPQRIDRDPGARWRDRGGDVSPSLSRRRIRRIIGRRPGTGHIVVRTLRYEPSADDAAAAGVDVEIERAFVPALPEQRFKRPGRISRFQKRGQIGVVDRQRVAAHLPPQGLVAGGKQHHFLLAGKFAKRCFKLLMKPAMAGQQMRGTTANTLNICSVFKGADNVRMIGEAQIIIAAKADEITTINIYRNALSTVTQPGLPV